MPESQVITDSNSTRASTFAEKGLGVTKAVGDLAGPMAFAVLMGLSRAFYGKYGDRINLDKFMALSGVLCGPDAGEQEDNGRFRRQGLEQFCLHVFHKLRRQIDCQGSFMR